MLFFVSINQFRTYHHVLCPGGLEVRKPIAVNLHATQVPCRVNFLLESVSKNGLMSVNVIQSI